MGRVNDVNRAARKAIRNLSESQEERLRLLFGRYLATLYVRSHMTEADLMEMERRCKDNIRHFQEVLTAIREVRAEVDAR